MKSELFENYLEQLRLAVEQADLADQPNLPGQRLAAENNARLHLAIAAELRLGLDFRDLETYAEQAHKAPQLCQNLHYTGVRCPTDNCAWDI